MVSNSFSILFFTRKRPNNSNDLVSIYLRITVNSKRTELSVQRKVNQSNWNSAAGKVKGSSVKVMEINKYLEDLRHKVFAIHSKLITKGKSFTA